MTGIICIDKPSEMTSFSVVARVRRIFDIKKAGHTGTLDPMATGVLPVMLGSTARFSQFLPSHEKSYVARIRLGLTTDTLDITGHVLSHSEKTPSVSELENIRPRFRGEIMQLPPMYSAVKSDGRRLYELARKGIEVERKARPVNVSRLELTAFDMNTFELTAVVSSGTYIRVLAADIGEALGCGATLTALRRTSACGFTLADAVTLDELNQAGNKDAFIKSVDNVLSFYPRVGVSEAQSARFCHGGELALDRFDSNGIEGLCRVYSNDERFLGLGNIVRADGEMKIARLLTD